MKYVIQLALVINLFLKSSCVYFYYWQFDNQDVLQYVKIIEDNYDYVVDNMNQWTCVGYCDEHDDCVAAKANGTNCFVYSTLEFVLTMHGDWESTTWFTAVKHPKSDKGEYSSGVRLRNHYKYLRSFSLGGCYYKCMKDPQCHAVTFDYGLVFQCYFYRRHNIEYDEDSSYVSVFKPPFDEVDIKVNLSLTSVYQSYSFKSKTFCYDKCCKDANCSGITFLTNTNTNNCLLVNNSLDSVSDGNAISYIKLFQLADTTPTVTTKLTITTKLINWENKSSRIAKTNGFLLCLLLTAVLIMEIVY